MTIDLDKKEYRALLELLSLGTWMLDADDEEPQEENQPYYQLLQKLHSRAAEAGCAEFVSEQDGMYFESLELEGWMAARIEKYDNSAFWEELVSRLAERDSAGGGIAWIEGLGEMEQLKDEMPGEQRWLEEFAAHGLDRLVIDPKRAV